MRGNFDQSLTIVRELGERAPVTVVNSVNPYRIEGQKSGAFEIVDELGDAPDVHCIPVGNAGNITAYWKGYLEFKEAGRSTRLPRMLGFQAAGAAPIVEGHPVEHPETVATAIRIGNPASWYGATSAASESGGGIAAVTDEEILDAYRFLAAEESVFCEPASAASVAGLLKSGLPDGLGSGATVVCVLTGHGLKDPDIAISQISVPTVVDADLGSGARRAVAGLIGGIRSGARGVPDPGPGVARLLPVWPSACTLVSPSLPQRARPGLWAGLPASLLVTRSARTRRRGE